MKHASEHEAVVLECLDRSDPRGALEASALGDCAVCRERVEGSLEIQRGLDALGRDLRVGVAPGSVQGEHLVAEVLGGRLALRFRARRMTWLSVSTAAAALVLVLWRLVPTEEGPPAQNLGAAQLALEAPLERVPTYGTFAWSARLPAAGWFEIRVFAIDGREIARATTEEARWTPASTVAWPTEIRWQVSAFDASGARIEEREARSSVPSP